MSQESKTAGAQYASYLRLLSQSVVEANNRRAQAHAQKATDDFAEIVRGGQVPGLQERTDLVCERRALPAPAAEAGRV
jgi:hypothetical protein